MNPELIFENEQKEFKLIHTNETKDLNFVQSQKELLDDFFYKNMPENFVNHQQLIEFFTIILQKIKNLEIEYKNTEESIYNSILEWNIYLPIIKQFITIGFCKPEDIKFILESISKFLLKLNFINFNILENEEHFDKEIILTKNPIFYKFVNENSKDQFYKIHNFIFEFIEICSLINIYRTNMISSVILKYFNSIIIKKNISYSTLPNFFSSFNKLIQIFSFDRKKNINFDFLKIENFDMLKFNLENQVKYSDIPKQILIKEILEEYSDNLIPDIKFSVLTIFNDLIVDMLNKRKGYHQSKKNTSAMIKYFNEIFYMKKLKKNHDFLNEAYYTRSLKIIPFIKKMQLNLNNKSLIQFAKKIEINPEVVNFFIYNIRKEDDILKTIDKIPKIIDLLENINNTLREEYRNKIYFKKIQKMIEVSQLEEIFLEIFRKIYIHVNNLEKSVDSFINSNSFFNNKIYSLFLAVKKFFILMMRKNNFNILKNAEEIKDQCIDVLMLYGFECDDLIKEIHLYLDFDSIFEDIRNIFISIDENIAQEGMSLIIDNKVDELKRKAPEILINCKLMNQYINILVELTNFPDVFQRKKLKSDILNKLLQTNFGYSMLNKEFLLSFAKQAKKFIPKYNNDKFRPPSTSFSISPSISAFSQERTRFFGEKTRRNEVSIKEIFENIFNMQKNIYNLFSDCLHDSTFCKMVFKSQNKMAEILDILHSKRMPLGIKNNFYRFLFDCFFSIGNLKPFNIVFLIKNILIPEIQNILKFCKAKSMTTSLNKEIDMKKIIKKIKKIPTIYEQMQDEDDEIEDVNVSKDSVEIQNDEEEDEDDDRRKKDIEIEEYSEEEDQNPPIIRTELPPNESEINYSKELTIFDNENMTLNTIWFDESELTKFLNEKHGSRFDGFLTFLADFTIYILFKLKPLKTTLDSQTELIKEFLKLWEELLSFFPKFEKKYSFEEIQHMNLLAETLTINFDTIWKECQKNMKKHDETFSQSYITNLRSTIQKKKEQTQSFSFSNVKIQKLKDIEEINENEYTGNLPSSNNIEGGDLDINTQQIIDLIKYSLLTLKTTFSEWIKEIFDENLVNMEKKVINSITKLIETAQKKKFNFLINFEIFEQTLNLKANQIPLFIKKINQGINSNEIDVMTDDEIIKTMIKIDRIIYSTDNYFSKSKQSDNNFLMKVVSFGLPGSLTFLENFNQRFTQNEKEIKEFMQNQTTFVNFLTFCELNMLKLSREMKANHLMNIELQNYFDLEQKNFQNLFKTKKIEKCLSNKNARFVFVDSIKQYILEKIKIKTKNQKLEIFQNDLHQKFVTLFCMKMIISGKENNIIINESFEIIYLLLLNGNDQIQNSLFQIISENFEYFNIVETMQRFLKKTFHKINEQINGIVPNFKWEGEEDLEYRSIRQFIKMDYFRFAINCFKFLQILNENCFRPFQDMFREQNFFDYQSKNNLIQMVIDHLIQIALYIRINQNSSDKMSFEENILKNQKRQKLLFKSIGFQEIINKKKDQSTKKQQTKGIPDNIENKDLKLIIYYGLDYLNDAMMGPNEKNQSLILLNPGLIDMVLSIIQNISFPEILNVDKPNGISKDNEIDYFLFEKAVKTLLIATNGDLTRDEYNYIFGKKNLELLNRKAEEVYNKIIRKNRQKLYSGSFTSFRNSVLSKISENEESLFEMYKLNKNNTDEQIIKIEYSKSMLFKIVQAGHDLFILIKRAEDLNNQKSPENKSDFYLFYSKFYGQIEVNVDNKIRIARFTKPYLVYFHYDSEKLLNDFDIEPHNEKIKNFIERNEMYQETLEIRRFQYKYLKPLYYLTKRKTVFEYFFFIILLLINLILIIYSKHEFDGDLNVIDLDLSKGIYYFEEHIEFSRIVLVVLGCVNSIQAFLIFFFYLFESIPSSKFYWKNICEEFTQEKISLKKKSKGLRRSYLKFMSKLTNNDYTLIVYWFNFNNIYNFLIVVLSVTSIFIPFFYPFLLLDIIQRFSTLKNIVKSVTNNWTQLTLTLILTLIIMYCYAMISFTFFPDHYEHTEDGDFQNYCHTLSQCFFSVVNNGLRAGGGLGEAIGQPTIDDTRYVLRYWMDLSFMIIILIVLLNIVFGIIIDTFGDMRAEKNEWINYIKTNCLICDMPKNEIDANAEGYYKHINSSHSVSDYVHFLIFIKKKNINDFDGIEQSVKKNFIENDFRFIPNQNCYHLKSNE